LLFIAVLPQKPHFQPKNHVSAPQIPAQPVLECRSWGSEVEATPPQILTHFNISLQFGCAIFYIQNKIPLAKILLHCIIHFMNETYTIRSPQQAILGLTTLLLRRKAQ